jgi:hypothetical protein
MDKVTAQRVNESFNSMLRTDYISLNDVEKLNLLAEYYVDYFGYLPQILEHSDQLLVGRRGTGKTTLVYRAFVECMRSWQGDGTDSLTPPRTLGIYIDLSKCHSLDSASRGEFADFEHVFVTELYEAISEQLYRFWPSLSKEPSLLKRIFSRTEQKRAADVQDDLEQLALLLREGLPRITKTNSAAVEKTQRSKGNRGAKIAGSFSKDPSISAELTDGNETETTQKTNIEEQTTYRLAIADILRILQSLREKADIPAILVYVDEFSSLSIELQRRFTTLLRRILGTHAGVFIKLCAITDNYTLGSSIILQRDLFEISLDLDAYIERNGSLNRAMLGLKEQVKKIVTSRLEAYKCPLPDTLFDNSDEVWTVLSIEAMGVPRTLGIVLQQAWNRQRSDGTHRIRKSDIDYGIRYASKAYLNQLLGASKDGIAIPPYVAELWFSLLERATHERRIDRKSVSHFLALPKNEGILKYLNMFFLIHLLTKGRTTTKKDLALRSLYCFDYGMCLENNFGYSIDRDILRQQRFAYDDVIAPYEQYYARSAETTFYCDRCGTTYRESELQIGGKTLQFCPNDRADLRIVKSAFADSIYTEEEIKIIGAIKSAIPDDRLVARQVADDVGCNVQKVAKFAEKLDKEELIQRQKDSSINKHIYYDKQ